MSNIRSPEARAQRRERIISAAVTLMLEKGPNVDLDKIAKAAGLAKGTLYLYIKNKEELTYAVRDDVRDSLLEVGITFSTARLLLLLEIEALNRPAFIRRFRGSPLMVEARRALVDDAKRGLI